MTNNMADIFEGFISQLAKWSDDGSIPDTASLDLMYSLELQKKRLDENNLKMKYTYTPYLTELNRPIRTWSDKEYSNTVCCTSYIRLKEIFSNGKRKYKDKENEFCYGVITDMYDQQSDKTYCCPNCGAIHHIKTLLNEGCPNCKTRFIMSDLFPKVTNYYAVKSYGEKSEVLKNDILKYVLTTAIIGIIISAVSAFIKNGIYVTPEDLAGCIGGGFAGAIFGYVLWAFSKVGSVFFDAARSIPKLVTQNDAKKRLPEFMLQYDPNFSYEYFIGKAIAMTKIMVFSSDYKNLAIYEGPAMENTNKDIIDIQFNHAVGLNNCYIKGAYCYLDISVYTTNTYFVNNRVKVKNEIFRMTLCKNISVAPDYGFSIRKVQCKGCGGSFDALREHNCPYCNKPYHLGDDDWVVLAFNKI